MIQYQKQHRLKTSALVPLIRMIRIVSLFLLYETVSQTTFDTKCPPWYRSPEWLEQYLQYIGQPFGMILTRVEVIECLGRFCRTTLWKTLKRSHLLSAWTRSDVKHFRDENQQQHFVNTKDNILELSWRVSKSLNVFGRICRRILRKTLTRAHTLTHPRSPGHRQCWRKPLYGVFEARHCAIMVETARIRTLGGSRRPLSKYCWQRWPLGQSSLSKKESISASLFSRAISAAELGLGWGFHVRVVGNHTMVSVFTSLLIPWRCTQNATQYLQPPKTALKNQYLGSSCRFFVCGLCLIQRCLPPSNGMSLKHKTSYISALEGFLFLGISMFHFEMR